MLPTLLPLTCIFFSYHVSATVYARDSSDAGPILGHTGWIDSRVRSRADIVLNHADYKVRNIDDTGFQGKAVVSASPSETAATPTPLPTMLPKDNATDAACMSSLMPLNGQAASAAGISVCYNVAYFNNSTGTFEADVRLYRVSPPTGEWASLVQTSASVGLVYPNASVADGTGGIAGRRLVRRQLLSPSEGHLTARADAPKSVAAMVFVGQLDSPMLTQAANDTAMRIALTPVVTLSGVAQDGLSMNTILSNQEASFVHGLFSDRQIAAGAASAQAQPTQFVLPGTTLGIFPISLVITGIWAFIFIAAVGSGTLGRIQFRNAYRRRATMMNQYSGGKSGSSVVVSLAGTAPSYDTRL